MSVYFIANIKMENAKEYEKYIAACDLVFEQYRGRYLSVTDNPDILEGQWDYTRLVLIEFPDRQALNEWYHSKSYQKILQHRLSGAKCDTIIVDAKPSVE